MHVSPVSPGILLWLNWRLSALNLQYLLPGHVHIIKRLGTSLLPKVEKDSTTVLQLEKIVSLSFGPCEGVMWGWVTPGGSGVLGCWVWPLTQTRRGQVSCLPAHGEPNCACLSLSPSPTLEKLQCVDGKSQVDGGEWHQFHALSHSEPSGSPETAPDCRMLSDSALLAELKAAPASPEDAGPF